MAIWKRTYLNRVPVSGLLVGLVAGIYPRDCSLFRKLGPPSTIDRATCKGGRARVSVRVSVRVSIRVSRVSPARGQITLPIYIRT